MNIKWRCMPLKYKVLEILFIFFNYVNFGFLNFILCDNFHNILKLMRNSINTYLILFEIYYRKQKKITEKQLFLQLT